MISAKMYLATGVIVATFDRVLKTATGLLTSNWAAYYANHERTKASVSALGYEVTIPTTMGSLIVHANTLKYNAAVPDLRDSYGNLVAVQGPITLTGV
jgi:hypothetical protein